MTTLASLINDVATVTNRPDLVEETRLAIKKATLKMHQADHFAKDIFETGISWNPPAFIQSLDYKSIVPNWRSLKYLRKYSSGVPGPFFTLLTPEESLDRYAINKENICYIAGSSLEIRSNTEDSYMLLGCYVNPVVTDAGYSSWIADEHPYAIVMEAAASVFKMIGADEQAAFYRQEVMEQLALVRQNQI